MPFNIFNKDLFFILVRKNKDVSVNVIPIDQKMPMPHPGSTTNSSDIILLASHYSWLHHWLPEYNLSVYIICVYIIVYIYICE